MAAFVVLNSFKWLDIDKNDTVIFFDDHQSALTRMMQMKWMVFSKMCIKNFPRI
jgi:hypothetical protein